ncbi:hypothetical protein GCM10020000_61520 [Streptomyces olivoverticillatus]
MTGFHDEARPVSRLTPPAAPEEFASPLKVLNDAGDLVSPTSWAAKAVRLVFECDPMETAEKWFAGDWEAYARCAEVWGNLGKFCADLAANIDAGNRELDTTWDGRAADAAYAYFQAMQGNLRDIQHSLEEMRREYLVASHGIWSTAEAVGQVLGEIGDCAATVAVSWAVGACASWTGMGAAARLCGGRRGIDAHGRTLGRGDRIGERPATQKSTQPTDRWRTWGGEMTGALNGFPLPRSAYDHPAV